MSKEAQKGGILGGRLWAPAHEKEPPPQEKVLPLKDARRPAAQQDRHYVAFEIREHAERMHIRRATQPSRFPSYNYLLDISYDHFHQSAFTLVYTFMIVKVTGANLEPIVHAISYGNCERMTEYHPKLHDAPGDTDPIIEKIEIVTADEKLMNESAGT